MSFTFPETECTAKCHSLQHASLVMAAITRGTEEEVISYMKSLCSNYSRLTDEHGRSPLHMAASCGKWRVVRWLLQKHQCDCNIRDKESGWTPLHRSLFYGQLASARVLLQYGANLTTLDRGHCTPLDLVMKDRPRCPCHVGAGLYEVYVWGINHNYNLGLGVQHSRPLPELVDYFRKADLSLHEVVMCKFHTVFMAADGLVYTCGHGQGGRLGHSTERTVLMPQLVKTISKENCYQVAAGTDHTVFMMKTGTVWTCGTNTHHQLGHVPPPEKLLVPKMIIFNKANKDIKVCGIRAARFHTVVWTLDGLLTFGLNAGQLGYPSLGTRLQTAPRLVSALTNLEGGIAHVAVSDGATICSTYKGEVYVCHEYQCRKIASRMDIVKLVASGGHLDAKADPTILKDKGGTELRVLILSEAGRMYLWSEGCPQFTRCWLSISRPLIVRDIALFTSGAIFMTDDGEGFIGTFLPPKVKPKKPEETSGRHSAAASSKQMVASFANWVERDQCFQVKTKRLSVIHRAAVVVCDRKGRNFAVLQAHPKVSVRDVPEVSASEMAIHMKSLLQEADIFDSIHDAVIQVGQCQFAAHQYVLALQCESFYDQIMKANESFASQDCLTLTVPNMHPSIMEQLLQFMYTGTCKLLTDGQPFHLSDAINANTGLGKGLATVNPPDLIVSTLKNSCSTSECNVNRSKKNNSALKLEKSRKKENASGFNPIKLLLEAAAKLGIHSLEKRLENVKFLDGRVSVNDKSIAGKSNFDRRKLTELYDLVLKAEDGKELKCHKCILVARSEYFHSMLASSWIETTMSASLTLPIASDILEVVIDYLYTDNALKLSGSDDAEFVCNVLVTADRLLISRLKEMCETKLTELLTLKNAAELLEFSWVYNASQLKATCNQYIGFNLTSLLESRSLQMLSDEAWVELTKNYRQLIPQMCYRAVTPYSDRPTLDEMQAIAILYPVKLDDIEQSYEDIEHITPTKEGKRIKNKRKNLLGRKISDAEEPKVGRVRNISSCSAGSEAASENELCDPVCSRKAIRSNVEVPVEQLRSSSSQLPVTHSSAQSPPVLPYFNSPPSTPRWLEGAEDMATAFPDILNELKQGTPVGCCSKASGDGFRKTPKMSQKQRKKLAAPSPVPIPQSLFVEQSIKSGKIWGASVATHVASLKEIMELEKGASNYVKLSRETISSCLGSQVASQEIKIETSSTVCHQTENAWDSRQQKVNSTVNGTVQNIATKYSSSATKSVSSYNATPCFSDILHSEEERLLNLAKIHTKSLHLIQLEDQAIDELLHYYQAENNPDEHITVERILPDLVAATPIWKLKKTSG